MVLRQVLQLHALAGPAPGACAIKLHQASEPAITAAHVQSPLVFADRGLRDLRPHAEDGHHVGLAGCLSLLEDFGQDPLVKRLHRMTQLLLQPALELSVGAGVFQVCHNTHRLQHLWLVLLAEIIGGLGQPTVNTDTIIVDCLVDAV